eukprot:gene402-6816_t
MKKKKFNFSNLTQPVLTPLTPLNPLSPRMNEIKKKEYKYSFSLFTSGETITTDELKKVYERLGYSPTDDEMKDLLTEIDIDKNGVITFDAYCALARRLEKYGDEELDLKACFDLFDQEKNGYITEKNLKEVMAAIGEELTETQLKNMMKIADSNSDGKIHFEDFKRFMKFYSKNDLLDKLYKKISEKNILEIEKQKEFEKKLMQTHEGDTLVKIGGKDGIGGEDMVPMTYIGTLVDPVELDLKKLKEDKNFDFEFFLEKKKAIEKFYYVPEDILKEDEKLSFSEKIFFWTFSLFMGYVIAVLIYKYKTSQDVMLQRSKY